MKRGLVTLILVFVAVMVTAGIVYQRTLPRSTPMGWLRTEFGLDEVQARRAEQIHAAYEESCREMCVKIAESDQRLKELIGESHEVTPEIQAAIAKTDSFRTECRTNMLRHFYSIADGMTPEMREKYLAMMLPVVLHPGEMQNSHEH